MGGQTGDRIYVSTLAYDLVYGSENIKIFSHYFLNFIINFILIISESRSLRSVVSNHLAPPFLLTILAFKCLKKNISVTFFWEKFFNFESSSTFPGFM